MKKLKIGLLMAVLSVFSLAGSARAANLTWDNDTTVTVGSAGYRIESNSEATTFDFDTTTLTVTVPALSTFTISSPDNYTLNNDQDLTATCVSGVNTLVITGAVTDAVVTPDTTTVVACVAAGSGGGGGGGSSATPATPATPAVPGEIPGCGNRTTGFSSSSGVSCVGNTATTPATPATPAATVIPGCGNRTTGFSSSLGTSCVGNSAGASASAPGRTYSLGTSTLKNGSRGEAAKELQRFLNDKLALGLVVDGIIGPKSIAVIKTWQRANGLVADGLIGRLTKAKINAQ